MFRGCTNLENIDLSNVTMFSYRLFKDTNITDVNAPNLVSSNTAVFTTCNSLQSVTSLGNLASIPDSMFWDCANLQTVNLPDNCTAIDGSAFTMWNVSTGSLQLVNGIEHVSSFGYRCFLKQKMLLLTANDLANAVSIGEKAFLNVLVSSINSPKLMTLGETSFADNSALTTIECLGKVSSIPRSCFGNDPSLLTVKIPYECTSIETNAFLLGSSLTSIKQYADSIDDWVEGEEPTAGPLSRVTNFGILCFYRCNQLLMSGSELSSATYIGEKAFEGVQFSGALDLSSLSGTIGEFTFYNTPITSVTIPLTVTRIDSYAFGNTNLTSITIPLSVQICSCTIVGGTAVTEIIFPEGCTLITDGQFSTKNNSLVYVEMPSTVTSMGFFFHRSLESSSNDLCAVVIKATTPPTLTYYKNNASNASSTTGNKFSGIYVPDASLTAYQGATGAWQHSSILAKLKPISLLLTDNPTAWARYNRTSTV